MGPSGAAVDDVAPSSVLLSTFECVPPLPMPLVGLRFGAIRGKTDLETLQPRHVRRLQIGFSGEEHPFSFQKPPKKKKGCNRKRYTFATGVRNSTNSPLSTSNSSRKQKQEKVPPVYSSAAWDHWTGRDCAARRPSRSLCLDLTSGPGRRQLRTAPDPQQHRRQCTCRTVP